MNWKDSIVGKIGRWHGDNEECEGMLCIVISKFSDLNGFNMKVVPLKVWYSPWILSYPGHYDSHSTIDYSNVGEINSNKIKQHIYQFLNLDSEYKLSNLDYVEICNHLNEYELNNSVPR